MKICLISDTHGYIDDAILKHLKWADEIWHGGDIGTVELSDRFESLAPFRAAWGNIDDGDLRVRYPESNFFVIQDIKFLILHIGGYPPNYNAKAKKLLDEVNPDVFIAGHSHILKVMRDHDRNLLYMNPGAAGQHGFHKKRTLLRFKIEQGQIKDLEVVELGDRGRL